MHSDENFNLKERKKKKSILKSSGIIFKINFNFDLEFKIYLLDKLFESVQLIRRAFMFIYKLLNTIRCPLMFLHKLLDILKH